MIATSTAFILLTASVCLRVSPATVKAQIFKLHLAALVAGPCRRVHLDVDLALGAEAGTSPVVATKVIFAAVLYMEFCEAPGIIVFTPTARHKRLRHRGVLCSLFSLALIYP